MKDQLLVAASRIAKLIVTVVALWLLERWKIDMSPAMRGLFEQLLAAGFVAGVLGLAAHFGIAIKANPMDTVSPTEARVGRDIKQRRNAVKASAQKSAQIDELVNDDPGSSPRQIFRPPSDLPHNHD